MGLLSSGYIQSPLELITSDNVLGCVCGESLRYSHLKIKLLENDIRLTRKTESLQTCDIRLVRGSKVKKTMLCHL